MVTANEAARNAATGLRIKKRRQELGMSQEDLAARISGGGVSKSTVQKWESGRHFPGRHLGSVEAVLGITLVDEQDVRPVPAPAPMSERLRRLMRDELGDERAARLIAHDEHLASGRTSEAGDDHPRGSDHKGRRSAG
jgi:transcriptional regulator with XRE-family HTH domain